MNMPLHQISVIPRDVTSSRGSGSSGKAKDKDRDKQDLEESPCCIPFCGVTPQFRVLFAIREVGEPEEVGQWGVEPVSSKRSRAG
ncbi:hypothetical protein SRHO_G00043160 [Serrasalmus rhombeus]